MTGSLGMRRMEGRASLGPPWSHCKNPDLKFTELWSKDVEGSRDHTGGRVFMDVVQDHQ